MSANDHRATSAHAGEEGGAPEQSNQATSRAAQQPQAPGGATYNIYIHGSTIGAFGAGEGVNVTGHAAPAFFAGGHPSAAAAPSSASVGKGAERVDAPNVKDIASVYLSYADDDVPFALKLFEALEAAGVSVFFRHEHARPGAHRHRSARGNIREYEHVILLCSERSLRAPSVVSELDEMLSREFDDGASERIIPILLDDFAYTAWQPRHPDIRRAISDRVSLDMKGAEGDQVKFSKGMLRLLAALKG